MVPRGLVALRELVANPATEVTRQARACLVSYHRDPAAAEVSEYRPTPVHLVSRVVSHARDSHTDRKCFIPVCCGSTRAPLCPAHRRPDHRDLADHVQHAGTLLARPLRWRRFGPLASAPGASRRARPRAHRLRLRNCRRCGGRIRSRAPNFRYCAACRADANCERSRAWNYRTRRVPRVAPKPRECPDYESSGSRDFAWIDGLLICRYFSRTEKGSESVNQSSSPGNSSTDLSRGAASTAESQAARNITSNSSASFSGSKRWASSRMEDAMSSVMCRSGRVWPHSLHATRRGPIETIPHGWSHLTGVRDWFTVSGRPRQPALSIR